MAESLRHGDAMFGVTHGGSLRGENDLEQQAAQTASAPDTCTIFNDLTVAVEIKLRRGSGWQPLYPESKLDVPGDNDDVSVRLRDAAGVCGSCKAMSGVQLVLSDGFGDFGAKATGYALHEEAAAAEEKCQREKRQKEIETNLSAEVTRATLWRQKLAIISISTFISVSLGVMCLCAAASYLRKTELQGVGLAVGLMVLWCCAAGGVGLLTDAEPNRHDALELQDQVRAARPELQGYEERGVLANQKDFIRWLGCFLIVLLVSGCSFMAMFGTSLRDEHSKTIVVLWGGTILLHFIGGIIYCISEKPKDCMAAAGHCLVGIFLCPFTWIEMLLNICGVKKPTQFMLHPRKKSLDAAVHATHERTIVFEGNVLPDRDTVCSWPGKYASAWAELVAGARQNDISAAVVFLPEGSQHFGLHDPIPAKEELQDLHGECWCTPLYGEQKPWGCRWWSKWIANIELAVKQNATLEVYYFNGKMGLGKVKDFTTAGAEHLRREEIFRRKTVFKKSEDFRSAFEAGLRHLSKEEGPDSSSPFSREEHRRFLAWLPEEERQILEESEGLGNSQKAEVAWLQRQGFPYVEKEVSQLGGSSPMATG
ncbi:unnamed protein product [Symbiodinium natans]|uniref:Uncharacterized protein n=1 Tax=Symbiodinium natans TaxID=878477 RepID=A0A812SEI2_9DINO|nr:unnamed protein product [Symbiodinium natans]